jgi:hypothetical protein
LETIEPMWPDLKKHAMIATASAPTSVLRMEMVGHAKQWAQVLAQWDDGNFSQLYPNFPCCVFPFIMCIASMLTDVTKRQVRTIASQNILYLICVALYACASN